ncbi:Hpt domain-containing protein [Desulfovibrio inopinatus]|uniref:Hpt domain-containing protein n=1 Tax=Desulfovibrio inopinatus TaxID=102109 RepID=UPI00041A5CDC|nr:Hpt domain-containing protein [Desulfovibrio inopinatus]
MHLDKETAIQVMGGDEDIYNEIFSLTASEFPGRLLLLKESISTGHVHEQLRVVHQLKGLMRTIGALHCLKLCYDLDDALRKQQTSNVEALVTSIEREADFVFSS